MAQGELNKKDTEKIVVKHVTFTQTMDIVPPPPNVKSEFNSLQDWLVNMCNTERPEKLIDKYNIGLFESSNDYYMLSLTGINTYEEGDHHSAIRVEFTPKHAFYRLPEAYYKNLSREELIKKLIAQLQDFTNTKDFKSSFFTKANAIVFDTNGQKIWSKQ